MDDDNIHKMLRKIDRTNEKKKRKITRKLCMQRYFLNEFTEKKKHENKNKKKTTDDHIKK